MSRQLEILTDRAAIIDRALSICLDAYKWAISTEGKFTLAAAGGSTPKPLYEALAKQPLDWEKVHVFWGDERYVPVTDPQSNEGMTRKAWLDLVAIPPENIHPVPTIDPDPKESAGKYEAHLQEFFGLGSGEFPKFSLILLGIGDDGHTASLFPHTEALHVSDRLVTVGQKDSQPRITFTAPLINQARQILFMVDGAAKAKALREIVAETGDSNLYPARLVQGNAIWLVDQKAASEIREG
ncbi:6-phosphogluconolactonase [Tumidithrix elongata RA019]|uniref:6-phosphogluconolactonase n=1 Tax=Tumidithrix elongata BACA0141 TaxID=2716417 RepID=A0AAW9PTL7_9CYAN|nr:6-phosphogluconolactonase [Tumidithrix elongata RA019]